MAACSVRARCYQCAVIVTSASQGAGVMMEKKSMPSEVQELLLSGARCDDGEGVHAFQGPRAMALRSQV